MFCFVFSSCGQVAVKYDESDRNNEYQKKLAYVQYDEYDELYREESTSYSRDHQIIDTDNNHEINELVYDLTNPINSPMDSVWPMKCHDNKHTGRSPYSTANNNGFEL